MRRIAGRVLVLGDDPRSFLAVVRSLGRRSLEVEVVADDRHLVATSRYTARRHVIRSPAVSEAAFVEDLSHLLKQREFDLVIPTSDPVILPLHWHRDRLGDARIAIPSRRALETCMNKIRSARLAAELGIPVPRSIVIETSSREERTAALEGFEPPLVLKPISSFSRKNLARRANVQVARTKGELEDQLTELLLLGPVLAQSFFFGTGEGIEFLALDGQILVAFQHRRIHEPAFGGGSSYRKSVVLDPELLEATQRFVGTLEYTGVGMAEFKRDPVSGSWVFVELNSRFWGSLPLALAAGVDFPFHLYDLLVRDRRSFPRAYRSGVYCRNLRGDLRWYVDRLRGHRPDGATVPARSRRALMSDTLRFLALREKSDTWALDDPLPGLVDARDILRETAARVSNRLRDMVMSVGPVRRRQLHRLSRAVEGAENLLFVCKGNICRSPFAERYVRAVGASSVRVRSTGYLPMPGRSSPRAAVTAARDFGVSLEGHRSRVLDANEMEWAHLVITFDEENFQTVRERYPGADAKLFRLSPGRPIPDPFGRDVDVFRETYRRIAEELEALLSSTGRRTGMPLSQH